MGDISQQPLSPQNFKRNAAAYFTLGPHYYPPSRLLTTFLIISLLSKPATATQHTLPATPCSTAYMKREGPQSTVQQCSIKVTNQWPTFLSLLPIGRRQTLRCWWNWRPGGGQLLPSFLPSPPLTAEASSVASISSPSFASRRPARSLASPFFALFFKCWGKRMYVRSGGRGNTFTLVSSLEFSVGSWSCRKDKK